MPFVSRRLIIKDNDASETSSCARRASTERKDFLPRNRRYCSMIYGKNSERTSHAAGALPLYLMVARRRSTDNLTSITSAARHSSGGLNSLHKTSCTLARTATLLSPCFLGARKGFIRIVETAIACHRGQFEQVLHIVVQEWVISLCIDDDGKSPTCLDKRIREFSFPEAEYGVRVSFHPCTYVLE